MASSPHPGIDLPDESCLLSEVTPRGFEPLLPDRKSGVLNLTRRRGQAGFGPHSRYIAPNVKPSYPQRIARSIGPRSRIDHELITIWSRIDHAADPSLKRRPQTSGVVTVAASAPDPSACSMAIASCTSLR